MANNNIRCTSSITGNTIYTIANTGDTYSFTIQPKTVDGVGGIQQHSDLTLYGNGTENWGERFNENFYRLVENFAVAEREPGDCDYIADEIWPKSSLSFSTDCNTIVKPNIGINSPIQGQLWFNTTKQQLFVYNGELQRWQDLCCDEDGQLVPNPGSPNFIVETHVAVAGQTIFDLANQYTQTPNGSRLLVFVNGKKLDINRDYVETHFTRVTLENTVPINDNDHVTFYIDTVADPILENPIFNLEFKYPSTAGQLDFTLSNDYVLTSDGSRLWVFVNGIKQHKDLDYLELGGGTTSNQIRFLHTNLLTTDVISFYVVKETDDPFTVEQQQAGNGQQIFTLSTPYILTTDGSRLLVFVNGKKLQKDLGYVELNPTQIQITTSSLTTADYVSFYVVNETTQNGDPIFTSETYVAVAGQSVFPISTQYEPTILGHKLLVFVNGVLQVKGISYNEEPELNQIRMTNTSINSGDILTVYVVEDDSTTSQGAIVGATPWESETFVATAGQTIFELDNPYTLTSDGSHLWVFVNGIKLDYSIDYNETFQTQFVLTSPLSAADVVTVYTSQSTPKDEQTHFHVETYVAVAGQTDFTLVKSYVLTTNGTKLWVFVDGEKLQKDVDYTEVDKHNVILLDPLSAGSVVSFYIVEDPLIRLSVGDGQPDTFIGGTLTEPLILCCDPVNPMGATTKQYVDNNFVSKSGDIVTGHLSLQDPVQPTHPVTLQYMQQYVELEINSHVFGSPFGSPGEFCCDVVDGGTF